MIISQLWVQEDNGYQSHIDELLSDTITWEWPLKIYSPEEREEREERLREICKANTCLPLRRQRRS